MDVTMSMIVRIGGKKEKSGFSTFIICFVVS